MLSARLQHLNSILDSFPRVMIAYSGGVDSACLLKAAVERLGSKAMGVIADTPSLPREELRHAIELGKIMGAVVEVVQTDEFDNPDYLSNPVNRCYFCKSALFQKMEGLARERGIPVLAYGENADDVRDVRPGAGAAAEFQIRAPLKEAGLTKMDVRQLCAEWNLTVADKPASPCLSSRIPHGNPVTVEALAQIESGEAGIRALGFRIFRLRHHGSRARLEFVKEELARAQSDPWREQIIQATVKAGYQQAEIDPQGYRSAL